MANIKIPKAWEQLKIKPVEESTYTNRRTILKQLGVGSVGLAMTPLLTGCSTAESTVDPGRTEPTGSTGSGNSFTFDGMDALYPAQLNTKYSLDRAITDEYTATHYNNFYEFINPDDPNIYNTYKYIKAFETSDWKVQVFG